MLGLALGVVLSVSAVSQQPAGSVRDSAAMALLQAARARRVQVDRRITAYRADVTERVSAGLRVVARERLMFRRDLAARIDWTRDTVRLEVVGAREVLPPIRAGEEVPAGLDEYAAHLAFDPPGRMLLPLDNTLVDPLDPDARPEYRYATGDTMEIRLESGRTVRLLELRVEPRRPDPSLVSGSFWFDESTFDLARMVVRPAADQRFGGRFFTLAARATLDRVTVEYALWDLTWWLPRRIEAEGSVQFGTFATVPMSYSRVYGGYSIDADSVGGPVEDLCRPPFRMVIRAGGGGATIAADPTDCDRAFEVSVADSAALLDAPALPPSVWKDVEGPALERPPVLPEPPWQFFAPRFAVPIGGFRYNRVEGFSPAVQAVLPLGRADLETEARMGTADQRFRWSVGLARNRDGGQLAVRAYSRLAVVQPEIAALSLPASIGTFVFGHDHGDYYRTRGIELGGFRLPHGGPGYRWRVFAERQKDAGKFTDFSIARLLDDTLQFRPATEVAEADQVGADVRIDLTGGLDPTGFQWGAIADVELSAGTFDYVRPSLLVRAITPLGPLRMLAEAQAGYSGGTVPPQRLWLMGGRVFVRGYTPATLRGDAFWRARAELSTGRPVARPSIFGDLAWAGPRDAFRASRPLASVGAGVSLMDGLFRMDLARALRAPTGWEFHFWFNAPL